MLQPDAQLSLSGLFGVEFSPLCGVTNITVIRPLTRSPINLRFLDCPTHFKPLDWGYGERSMIHLPCEPRISSAALSASSRRFCLGTPILALKTRPRDMSKSIRERSSHGKSTGSSFASTPCLRRIATAAVVSSLAVATNRRTFSSSTRGATQTKRQPSGELWSVALSTENRRRERIAS